MDRTSRINIICQVYGTSIERLRKLRHCIGNDLQALKDISKYLHYEEHLSLTDIGDLLFRDRTTIRYYLKFDTSSKPYENVIIPAANGGLLPQGIER